MPVLLNANAVTDSAGRFLMTSATVTNIAARKGLEQQLRQSQKMEAIGRLAGGVAHDFNNLLTVILGYSKLALSRTSRGDFLYEQMDEIRKAGQRASALTTQLLAFSRRQILRPRVLDLNAVVSDMDKMLRRLIGEHIALVTVPDPALGRVRADPGQIEQVIMNLAVNARDAMAGGGTLTILTLNLDDDDRHARGHPPVPPGPYVVLAVSDTGAGMDEEVKAQIFEPFFTTKGTGKGTGLGLSTVYGIVDQSGGHIRVDTAKGRGTSFGIYLPRVQEEAPAPEPVLPPGPVARGRETILLVEDEEAVRTSDPRDPARRGLHRDRSRGRRPGPAAVRRPRRPDRPPDHRRRHAAGQRARAGRARVEAPARRPRPLHVGLHGERRRRPRRRDGLHPEAVHAGRSAR